MGIHFNIDEIFEIAEQIERNGARFYRRASEMKKISAEQRNLLYTLSLVEEKHEKIFSEMRLEIIKNEKLDTILNPDFDPEGQSAMYLHAIADSHVFNIRKDPSEFLTGKETINDILKIALDREKDSIIFYLGIKEIVRKDLGQEKVDLIIKEEMTHITYINKELLKTNKDYIL